MLCDCPLYFDAPFWGFEWCLLGAAWSWTRASFQSGELLSLSWNAWRRGLDHRRRYVRDLPRNMSIGIAKLEACSLMWGPREHFHSAALSESLTWSQLRAPCGSRTLGTQTCSRIYGQTWRGARYRRYRSIYRHPWSTSKPLWKVSHNLHPMSHSRRADLITIGDDTSCTKLAKFSRFCTV